MSKTNLAMTCKLYKGNVYLVLRALVPQETSSSQRAWCHPSVTQSLSSTFLLGLDGRKRSSEAMWGSYPKSQLSSGSFALQYSYTEKQNHKEGRKKTRLTFWETKGSEWMREGILGLLSKTRYFLRLQGNWEGGSSPPPYIFYFIFF